METPEELDEIIEWSIEQGTRTRILERGAAWRVVHEVDGVPPDGERFGESLGAELERYGFGLLRATLALADAVSEGEAVEGGFRARCERGFLHAARALEAAAAQQGRQGVARGHYRTLAGAAYHLAGSSAMAYSLLDTEADLNLSPAEAALQHLILRRLPALTAAVRTRLVDPAFSDERLVNGLKSGELARDEALSIIVDTSVFRALAFFDFALHVGRRPLVDEARTILERATRICAAAALVPAWWLCRLIRHLLDDLWAHSLHERLDPEGLPGPPIGDAYADLRRRFIATLYRRGAAEIELWPAQLEAVRRCADPRDDLVVALPTSAGKTRVAEIAALVALGGGRRVVVVTPLRALSAQTERSFRRTFAPLGIGVSALYGPAAPGAVDADALRHQDIVVSTPEKLDFALRSDPALIDDVGLIVLDEGHMIGPSDREVRYEILIQRLLRRPDAAARRLVCLSAVLPEGPELDELTRWIRNDAPGDPVRSLWRPTRQRFSALIRDETTGGSTLALDLEDAEVSAGDFVGPVPARGKEKRPYPRDVKDLTLLAAWRFAEQGRRAMIYCPEVRSVTAYSRQVCNLVDRGYLATLPVDAVGLERVVDVGREWLGEGHPVVRCLGFGVGVHHAKLPRPFLTELERALGTGALQVVVASPTLAQGLNLSASVLLVPSLHRHGARVPEEELANVFGRVGRAFVDVEGLVVHVIFDDVQRRASRWVSLIASARVRTLQSGLLQTLAAVTVRLADAGVLGRSDAVEYLAGSRAAWQHDGENLSHEDEPLAQLVDRLDGALLGLVDALEAEADDLPQLLDDALRDSLWHRQVLRESPHVRKRQRRILLARAQLVWSCTDAGTRRAYFAMGVGLEAGQAMDAVADEMVPLLDAADAAAVAGKPEALVEALRGLGGTLLELSPFRSSSDASLPEGWPTLLSRWIRGDGVDSIGTENMPTVENLFVYRLGWALEVLRTRRAILSGVSPASGAAAAALEAGVPSLSAALLVRAGLSSRRAAMAAVRLDNASFDSPQAMRRWLRSPRIRKLGRRDDWPGADLAPAWRRFLDDRDGGRLPAWRTTRVDVVLDLTRRTGVPYTKHCRVETDASGTTWLVTPDFRRLVPLAGRRPDLSSGLLSARWKKESSGARITRMGP